jgi:hypothetical protein
MATTIERTVERFGGALAAIGSVGKSAKAARQMLALLGWDLPPGATEIGLAGLDVALVASRLDDLSTLRSQPDVSDADLAIAIAGVVDAVVRSVDDIHALVDSFQATPDYLTKTRIREEFFDRLAGMLVIHAMGSVVPASVPAATLLGVFEFMHKPADPTVFQVEHIRQVLRWDRLGTLFTDPSKLLRDVYGWGTPSFQGNALVANIGRVVEFIAADVKARALPRLAEEQFAGRPVPEADTDPAAQYFVSLDKGIGIESFDVGLSLFPMRASAPGGTDGGVGIAPYLFGTTDTTFEVSDTVSLVLSGSQQLQGGVAVLLRAGKDPQVITGLLDELQSGTAPAEFSLMLRAAAPAGERYTILSAPDLTIDAAALSGGGGLTIGSDVDPTLTAKVDDACILVKPQSPDSFIASLLPEDGISANANLEVSWSNRGGLRFKGDAGLNATLAINKRIGPLRVDSATLALKAANDRIEGSVGVAGGAQIGPVSASVTGVGANVTLKFARGNLGPVDLGATFRPPNGIGLAVDAKGVLTGGGFLFHDAAQGLYAGAMQLSLNEQITLKAFGLIATRMPDGSRGYSMIVFITAEDFRPIPLIMGMTLLGIGGMVGIHRTFDEDVLRQGLKSGTLATLLFPRDPVGNALTLIQNLARAFPARRGSYLLGLLAKIGWPTPTLVTLDLALILEFGARQRLVALGRISALLPSADNDLVRLNMEAMGVLDFDEGTAAIDAVLFDSRLAQKFPITGSAALRAGFGTGPSFVLSVGGFNPHFAAPSTVPGLQRVAIALSSGSNPRLVCDAYLAITSNTLQFGANASLYAAAAGFSVEGDIGYDVLIQMVPLHFLAEFHARMQLKRGSHNLFGVSLNGALEGPRPLRVSGKATFSILWCDFSVHFDTTLVKGERPPLPPAVSVLAQLTRALAAPMSWSTERSATQTHGVALRSLPPASATAPIVLDPLGQVAVRQQVVPLNTARDIDLFGGAPVAGARRFGVTATLSGTPLTNTPLRGDFAPAQFFAMTDDQKLAAPSFESMDAGCVFGDAKVAFDATQVIAAALEYESIAITLAGPALTTPAPPAASAVAASAPARTRVTLSAAQLQTLAPSGAAGRAPVRRVGRTRFRNDAVEPAAAFNEPEWEIVPKADGAAAAVATIDSDARTWSEYQSALTTLNRAAARWQIVPAYELKA